jgi:hypothetical protein
VLLLWAVAGGGLLVAQAAAPGPREEAGDAVRCREHAQLFRLAAASRVAALGARYKACQKGLSPRDECDRVWRQGSKVGPLRHWAKRENRVGWKRLAKAAEHYEAARQHSRGQSFEACQADLELSLAYRLFAFEDPALEGLWQAGLTGGRRTFRPVQAELADVLALSAECLLELAHGTAAAGQLLRAHIALVAAGILRRQGGGPGAPGSGYLQALREQVSAELSEALEQAPLEVLQRLAWEAGLAHSSELQDGASGLAKDIPEALADGRIFRHIALETGKLAQGLHGSGVQVEVAPQRGGAAGGGGAESPSPSRAEAVTGQWSGAAWENGSEPSLSFVPQWLVSPALGVVPRATIMSLSPSCQQAGSGQGCLPFFAQVEANVGLERSDEACERRLEDAFNEWWARVQAGEAAPESLDAVTENALVKALLEMGDEQYREVFPHYGSAGLFGDFSFVAEEPTFGRGDEAEGQDGLGGQDAQALEDSRQAQDRQMQEELLRRAQNRQQGDGSNDDYMVNLILLGIVVLALARWFARKHRKDLQNMLSREIARTQREEFERQLDMNEVSRLVAAMESADASRLARVIEEVKYVDPAMLKRARSLLVQRRRQEKAQEQAKSKAKAAKARGKTTKAKATKAREEKQSGAMLSTSAAVAATRARLQGEAGNGGGGTTKEDEGLSISDTSSDVTQEDFEDFQSVASDSRVRRRKVGNHGGDAKRDGSASGGKQGSKAAQAVMQKSISQVIAALRRRPNMAGAMSHIGIPADARMRAKYAVKPGLAPQQQPASNPAPSMAAMAAKGARGGSGSLGTATTGPSNQRSPVTTQAAARQTTQKAWGVPPPARAPSKPAPPRPDYGEQAQDHMNMPYLSWMTGSRGVERDSPAAPSGPAVASQWGLTAAPVSKPIAQQGAGPTMYSDAGLQPGGRPEMSAMAKPFNASSTMDPVMPPVMAPSAPGPSAGAGGLLGPGSLAAVWAASERGHQRSKSSDWSAAANHLAAVNDARRVQLHGGEPLLDSGEWLAESLLAEIR